MTTQNRTHADTCTDKRPPTLLAEWAPQSAVMLAWPHQDTDWAPWLPQIEASYVDLLAAITETAVGIVLCQDSSHAKHIQQLLQRHAPQIESRTTLIACPYNDTWCRDYGPLSLGNNGHIQQLVTCRFTGWGNKYSANADNNVNSRLAKAQVFNVPLEDSAFELEGGAIETDGQGTLLTTSACLLADNRNKTLNQEHIESTLKTILGVQRVLWINHGMLIGDDTDSHVDNLVRFANPDTLIYARCNDPNDPHYEPLRKMEEQLNTFTTMDGAPYHCIPVDIPSAIVDEQGTRLPASYINFLILNDTVIMPTFQCAADANARQILQQAFPQHRVLDVDGRYLIRQFGGPHCATMQLPLDSITQDYLRTVTQRSNYR